MMRKRSTSCRKTTESSSLTSSPALACWDVWRLTIVSPYSQGYILCIIMSSVEICEVLALLVFPCPPPTSHWHQSCNLILQPAGGPGDTAARSTPEDSAAPHGLIWTWICRPESSWRPLWGHPLAHTGLRSGARHKSLFLTVMFTFWTLGFGTQVEFGVQQNTSHLFWVHVAYF